LWLEQALGRERAMPTPAAEGRLTADICIVGGGYTGLWTAIRILEADPGASVFVLEGDLCGAGASGRNGGFALTWWPKIETDRADRGGRRLPARAPLRAGAR
jgi:glycine/D-amino acid oxidase-like deaminating enzyme